ncbi:MAG: DUF421 domain-containing protein [Clostridia bacterium]|nr:DUF421 domain-containing protein [Clostridia bacterium]
MLMVIVKTVIIYVFLLLIMRLMGKRELGQIQTFELVISMIIADTAAVPIYDEKASLLNALVSVSILFLMHMIISFINMRSVKGREIFCGKPRILINKGRIEEEALKKESITINELQERLREKDVFNLGDVEYVILETSGQISVVPKPEKRALKIEDLNIKSEYEGLAFDLVLDGKVMSENLKLIGKDYRWLEKQTKEFGIKPEEALVVTINGDNSFYCQAKKRKKC